MPRIAALLQEHLLLTTYYLLLATCYLLLTTYYLPLTICNLLLTTSLTTYYAHYLLRTPLLVITLLLQEHAYQHPTYYLLLY